MLPACPERLDLSSSTGLVAGLRAARCLLIQSLPLTFVLKFFTKCRGLQRIFLFVIWERGLEVHCYADL